MTQPGLSNRIGRGVAMLVAQTVGVKILSTIGQLVLAYLLAPELFGLYFLALAVTELIGVVQKAGIREVLIRRQHAIHHWINAGFWLSTALGLGAMLIGFAVAPIAAYLKDEPDLVWPIVILAISIVPWTTSGVLSSVLERDMRFGAVTGVQLVNGVLLIGLQVLLAALGFGVYSFVLPRLLVGIERFVSLWLLVRPPIRARPGLRLWPYYYRDSGKVFAAALVQTVSQQGGVLALGIFAPPAAIGVFGFAFAQSTQVAQLLSVNLGRVLLPGLSRLSGTPARQAAAFERAARLLAIVATPACAFQVAVAEPVLIVLYGDKWLGAVLPLQLLSASAVFAIIAAASMNFLLAQARYSARLRIGVVRAVALMSAATIGAAIGDVPGVAVAILLARVIVDPIMCIAATSSAGIDAARVLLLHAQPLLGSALSFGAAVAVVNASLPVGLETGTLRILCHVAAIGSLGTSIYALWVRLTARNDWQDIVGRVRDALPAPFARRIPTWIE